VLLLYNACLIAALLIGAPFVAVALLVSPRLRGGMLERLRPLHAARGGVWVHAASMGEVAAASPLIAALAARDVPLLATTTSLTGRAMLRERFPDLGVRLAPLDLPGFTGACLRRAGVAALVLVETELWPNTLAAAARRGVDCAIVSARISDRSLPRYRRLRFFFSPLLRRLAWVHAQTESDAARYVELGVPEDRVSVGGDLKLDRAPAPPPDAALVRALGAGPLFLAGSVRPGEEEPLLEAWERVRAEALPELRLVLAPRHPEQAAGVAEIARKRGLRVALRSAGPADSSAAEVVVIDVVGELRSLYALADVVFVGGTLVPVGGHNLLEPVEAGRIVLHGPHTHNQRGLVDLLEPLGVLRRVRDGHELASALAELVRDPERNAPAREAARVLAASRGALDRALERILETPGLHASDPDTSGEGARG